MYRVEFERKNKIQNKRRLVECTQYSIRDQRTIHNARAHTHTRVHDTCKKSIYTRVYYTVGRLRLNTKQRTYKHSNLP